MLLFLLCSVLSHAEILTYRYHRNHLSQANDNQYYRQRQIEGGAAVATTPASPTGVRYSTQYKVQARYKMNSLTRTEAGGQMISAGKIDRNYEHGNNPKTIAEIQNYEGYLESVARDFVDSEFQRMKSTIDHQEWRVEASREYQQRYADRYKSTVDAKLYEVQGDHMKKMERLQSMIDAQHLKIRDAHLNKLSR